jgi:hypothetical protein
VKRQRGRVVRGSNIISQQFDVCAMRRLCNATSRNGPARDLVASMKGSDLANVSAADVRPVRSSYLISALRNIRASVAKRDLDAYEAWNGQFGSLVRGPQERGRGARGAARFRCWNQGPGSITDAWILLPSRIASIA